MKCRQILIRDTNGKQYDSFWCDCTNCDGCALRYKCYTSNGDLVITFPAEGINKRVKTLREKRWRLRNGSNEQRSITKGRPTFSRHESVQQVPI